MEFCNQDNIEKFIKEVSDANIYDQLNPALNTNTNYNYKILSELLQTAKSSHIPRKIRKFNKRKHTKEKWMTRELLTEVVKKTKLYVEWKTTSVTHVNYDCNKQHLKLTILTIITVISSTYIIRRKKDSNLNVLPRMTQQK